MKELRLVARAQRGSLGYSPEGGTKLGPASEGMVRAGPLRHSIFEDKSVGRPPGGGLRRDAMADARSRAIVSLPGSPAPSCSPE